jgi:hypothetical protein
MATIVSVMRYRGMDEWDCLVRDENDSVRGLVVIRKDKNMWIGESRRDNNIPKLREIL